MPNAVRYFVRLWKDCEADARCPNPDAGYFEAGQGVTSGIRYQVSGIGYQATDQYPVPSNEQPITNDQ